MKFFFKFNWSYDFLILEAFCLVTWYTVAQLQGRLAFPIGKIGIDSRLTPKNLKPLKIPNQIWHGLIKSAGTPTAQKLAVLILGSLKLPRRVNEIYDRTFPFF